MKLLTAALAVLALTGFAGAAMAECNWSAKAKQETAEVPPIVLPENVGS